MKITAGKVLTVAIATAICGSAFAEQEKGHDEMSGHSKDRMHTKMTMMDADKDGKVSATEHAAGAQQMFQTMDANHDGRVTAEEMDTHKPMKSRDASHGDEHGKAHAMSSVDKIKKIDTDGDGVLTAQEHSAGAKKMFTKMDANKDGHLTAAEIRTGHERMMSHDE